MKDNTMTDQNQDVLKRLERNTKQLLTRPKKIDFTYCKSLISAYHNAIDNLTTHFNFRSELKPAFPINVYYYSDNHLLHDPAIDEIDNYLDSSINAVSFISGIEAPKVTQGYTLSQDWISGGFDLPKPRAKAYQALEKSHSKLRAAHDDAAKTGTQQTRVSLSCWHSTEWSRYLCKFSLQFCVLQRYDRQRHARSIWG